MSRRWRWPRSLAGRLLGIAALSTVAALVFAGVTIGTVLQRFVMHGLDDRLDAQVSVLVRSIRPDGTMDPARTVELPGFDEPGSGWAWRVDGPGRLTLTSGPAADTMPVPPAGPQPPHEDREGRQRGPERPRPGEGQGRGGERLHMRTATVPTSAGPVTITAVGPRRVADAPLREAMVPLLFSLALLGVGLGLATWLQLRFGLGPLRALRRSLGEVRAGRRRHVPGDQPAELAPLVGELNALIDQNEAGLAHARRHVANLAHGLKTPLAALALKLEEAGRDPDGSLAEMVRNIDGRVRHHLGRARAATSEGARHRTPIAPAVADLVSVLRRIHADRPVTATIDVAADLAVAVDPQDLDEMLGNLLDNGWRHARDAVEVHARIEGAMVVIAIRDDGEGIADTAIREALMPGRRLDERGDGHGFGLSITQELAELNGGTLLLMQASDGRGFIAQVTLPIRL